MQDRQYEITVFNVELEGIDKCGKDTVRKAILEVFPNICSYKARGILSQLAYERLYNRPWSYPVTEGYLKNTLIVKLDVYEKDWRERLDFTDEIAFNASRSDVDFVSDYLRHTTAFNEAWDYLRNLDIAKNYQDHFMRCNTSLLTDFEIAQQIKQRVIELNHLGEDFKL